VIEKNKQLLKDSLGWGLVLWLIGYVLSFILFFMVPPLAIGWIIAPIGTVITWWVLFKKIKSSDFKYYLILGIVWGLMAIILDYFFIVKLLNPTDYYKTSVHFYYFLTFTLPWFVGSKKENNMDQKVLEYINKQKSPQKEICKRLKKVFLKNFPNVKEEMKLGVPYYGNKFYMVALKDQVNFGFEIKNFSKEEIKQFQGGGKTVKVLEIRTVKEIDESKIIEILMKVLN